MKGGEGRKPLAGKRIVVTRPSVQALSLERALAGAGAAVVLLPVIRIAPPRDSAALRRAAAGAAAYDWIAFTSINSVAALRRAREELGLGLRGLSGVMVAAVGEATAEAAAAWGLRAALVPAEFTSEALARALVKRGIAGQRVLIPRSEQGRTYLADALRAAGAEVDEVAAYRTEEAPLPPGALRAAFEGRADALAFASPSAVKALGRACARAGLPWPWSAPAICIGPVTAQEARRQGLAVAAVARPHTAAGLFEAIATHFGKGG